MKTKEAWVSVLLLAGIGAGCSDSEPPPDGGTGPAARPMATVPGVPAEDFDHIVQLFNQGIGLMERFRPVEAVQAFDEAVRLAPEWTTARLNLGIALLNAQGKENYARAEEELERVLESEPDSLHAHYALGMLFRHLARFDEARAHFERVLELDPDDPDAHYQLGILILNEDPAAARRHLEQTLAAVPHHESACYRLATLLRQQGDMDGARRLLARFRLLKETHAGLASGMKYGEMGRYAGIVRAVGPPVGEAEPSVPPAYADRAPEAGLGFDTPGTPGWPGEAARLDSGTFAPGVAVADLDGDGDLDLFLPQATGGACLHRNDGGRFTAADTAVDARGAVGGVFGDYDRDGDPDLFLTCAGPDRLYRNDGAWSFTDVTEATGVAGGPLLSVGAAWADADHDGDLDLYVCRFGPAAPAGQLAAGAPNALWRNNGDGTFLDVAAEAGVDGGRTPSTGVLFLDADGDHDLDLYVIHERAANQLFLNLRVGQYAGGGERFADLAEGGPGLGAVLADLDLNGLEDLLLLRGPEPPRLFLQLSQGAFQEDFRFRDSLDGVRGATGALAGDLDLDGDPDLVLTGCAGSAGGFATRVLMNDGTGRFAPPVPIEDPHDEALARGAVLADLDGDGSLDLLLARAGTTPALWKAQPPAGRHWLEVVPALEKPESPRWADPTSVGLLVEVKTGRRLQTARVASASGYLGGLPRRLHFGLGDRGKADYVRLFWADSVLQSEMEVAADQSWRVAKVLRKPSSCPLLFSWDGERFAFVTDFLGVGGLGFFLAPGEYAPPDPTEDVRIPPEQIRPRDGRYLLRVTEPLEEVSYLDTLELIAYDHPAGWEVHPDERFAASPPSPTGRPVAVARKVFPVAARDDSGQDVLDRVLAIDRRYVEPPVDPRFVGYAQDHWLELDFGDRLAGLPADAPLVLFLHGWVEYTYSHVNYAAWQAGVTMRPPAIEIPDGKGGWRVAIADAGFPAGLPRMMTVDLSGLPIRETGRLRIRSSMEIFWDQAFVASDRSGEGLRTHRLLPEVAELRPLGYPREYSPDGSPPALYDYDLLDRGVPFKNMAGDFTAFGDVREQLAEVDDCFVIMARGDEIALEFDATALPALPEGWTRTVVLHADGYCKDMDLYTAFPDTVAPLPHHAMANYPPDLPAPPCGHDRTHPVRHVASR